MVFGVSAAIAFADDPFKNIGEIDDVPLPVGYVDNIKILLNDEKPLLPNKWF
jgi:hypothetical protein